MRRLQGFSGEEQAAKAAEAIAAKSPTAVKVALASLRRVKGLSLEKALEQEYRVGLRFLAGSDFREGIRAQVVDKDYSPRWQPATLAEVSDADVDSYFAPLGNRELILSEEHNNV